MSKRDLNCTNCGGTGMVHETELHYNAITDEPYETMSADDCPVCNGPPRIEMPPLEQVTTLVIQTKSGNSFILDFDGMTHGEYRYYVVRRSNDTIHFWEDGEYGRALVTLQCDAIESTALIFAEE